MLCLSSDCPRGTDDSGDFASHPASISHVLKSGPKVSVWGAAAFGCLGLTIEASSGISALRRGPEELPVPREDPSAL